MREPDLLSYDWIVLNSSAGKDSQTMIDKVVGMAKELRIRNKVTVVHADLGRCEWKGTRELAEEQAKFYGVRFIAVKRPQGDLLSEIRKRGRFPSSKQRYCTSDHKRGQVDKVLTYLTKISRGAGKRQVRILNCLGIRAQESHARRKKAPFMFDTRASNSLRHVDQWLPIFTWSVEQVWENIHRSGCPYHRAYSIGMPRLSCCFCIFAPRSALLIAGEHNRELLDEYVQVEKEIGHKFRLNLPIVEIAEALDKGERSTGAAQDWKCS